MTRIHTRAAELRRGFFFHLGVFLVANLGFVIVTAAQSGEFWWYPFTVIWGLSVAGYGALAYWVWRRDRWEEETGDQRRRLMAPPNPLD